MKKTNWDLLALCFGGSYISVLWNLNFQNQWKIGEKGRWTKQVASVFSWFRGKYPLLLFLLSWAIIIGICLEQYLFPKARCKQTQFSPLPPLLPPLSQVRAPLSSFPLRFSLGLASLPKRERVKGRYFSSARKTGNCGLLFCLCCAQDEEEAAEKKTLVLAKDKGRRKYPFIQCINISRIFFGTIVCAAECGFAPHILRWGSHVLPFRPSQTTEAWSLEAKPLPPPETLG